MYLTKIFVICFLLFSAAVSYEKALKEDLSIEASSKNFVRLDPPSYDSIETSEYKTPSFDYLIVNKRVDQDSLSDIFASVNSEAERYVHYTRTQKCKTKITAWQLSPLISSLNTAYLLTGNKDYLRQVSYFYRYYIGIRMDNQNRIDFQGKLLPQWERLDRYNIFTVSPYKDYSSYPIDELMIERGWQTTYFSDVNYSGLILEQFLRFAQIVISNDISEFKDTAISIINESKRTIDSHEHEYVNVSDGGGYYIFPKNSPFYLDGVEIPVNEAAPFGSALLRLGVLSGDKKYSERALQMWNHWQKSFARDKYGYIIYPYVTGKWRDGWSSDDSPSINTPESPSVTGPEVFHKAGLTIHFMVLIDSFFGNEITSSYLNEFKKAMIAASATKNKSVISKFPNYLGFWYPKDSVHEHTPYYDGWVEILSDDSDFLNDIVRDWRLGKVQNAYVLLAMLYADSITFPDSKSETIKIQPDLLSERSNNCDIKLTHEASGQIIFKHTSPKHNKLFLYVNKNKNQKIRLKLNKKENYFEGNMYIPADQCINLSWDPIDKYAYPASTAENWLEIKLIYQ
jgi:hypothetical protein